MPNDIYGTMIKDDLAELQRDLACEGDLFTCLHWPEFHAGRSRYHLGTLKLYLQRAEALVSSHGPQDQLANIRATAACVQRLVQSLEETQRFIEQWSESQTCLIAAKADDVP
jgi:hypothetical protein